MKYVIIPDLHSPGHHRYMLNALLNYLNSNNPYGLIFSGDFLDATSLSFYDINNKFETTLGQEYEIGSDILDQFDQAIDSSTDKHFLYGNHEDRFIRTFKQNTYARLADAIKTPEEGLKIQERGYKVYKEWMHDQIELGDYIIVHGLYTNMYPAKKHVENYQSNIIFGHSHRINTHYIMGYYGLNIGWGGDKNNRLFRYMPRAQRNLWKNAFATLDIIDGKGYPQIHMFDDTFNRFVIEGKVYK